MERFVYFVNLQMETMYFLKILNAIVGVVNLKMIIQEKFMYLLILKIFLNMQWEKMYINNM